jgi:hypothetical protein
MGGRRRIFAVLGALALASAGCGGTEERNAYVDEVNRAQTAFARDFERVTRETRATATPEESQRLLRDYRAVVTGVVRRLRAADPPGEVRGLHDELVGQFQLYDGQLTRFGSRLRSTRADEVLRAQAELTREVSVISRRIEQTIGRLNDELRG